MTAALYLLLLALLLIGCAWTYAYVSYLVWSVEDRGAWALLWPLRLVWYVAVCVVALPWRLAR